MKRMISLLLCLAMALALCACGGAKESEKPADMQSTLPGTAPAEEALEATEAPVADEEAAIEEKIQTVRKLKDRPVSEVYEAIGEPVSEDSAPSCLGPGEDVNLYYDGFTVYTYKEGANQIVIDVERSK